VVRLVVLHTAYTIADIYDPDRGPTRSQLLYLAEGILAREREEAARALEIQSALGPLWAAAVATGFSGDPKPVTQVTDRLRQIARRLTDDPTAARQTRRAAPAPTAVTANATADTAARRDDDGGTERPDVMAVIGSHPLFTVNLGRPL
jgi:hypothetical protein